MKKKIHANSKSIIGLILLCSFFLVVFCTSIVGVKAEGNSLELTSDQSEIKIDEVYHFKLEVNNYDHTSPIVLSYPTSFIIDTDKIKQINESSINKITDEPNTHELTITLNDSLEFAELVFEGIMSEQGEFQFESQINTIKSNSLQLKTILKDRPTNGSDTPEAENQNNQMSTVSIDNPGDLEDWEPMQTNEPVEFPTKNNTSGRKYYMYFGTIDTGQSDVAKETTLGVPILDRESGKVIPRNYPDIGHFNILVKTEKPGQGAAGDINGYPNKNQQWMSYNYKGGRTSGSMYGLQLARSDIDNPYPLTMIMDPNSVKSPAEGLYNTSKIDKLFKKKNGSGIRAYALNKQAGKTIGEVRITMTPVSNSGRININIRYLNLSGKTSNFTFYHGTHLDVAGNHTKAPLKSLGNFEGVYQDADGVSADQITPDSKPYRIYMFKDGYPNQPTQMRPKDIMNYTDSLLSYWGGDPNAIGILPSEDPGRGKHYRVSDSITTSSMLSFKWDTKKLASNEFLDSRFDVAVTEESDTINPPSNNIAPKITLTNHEGRSTGKDYELSGTWTDEDSQSVVLKYKVDDGEYKVISENQNDTLGAINDWTYTIPASEIPKGNHKIEVIAVDTEEAESNQELLELKLMPKLIEEVTHQDGSKAETGQIGETLHYKTILKNPYSDEEELDTNQEIARIASTGTPKVDQPQPISIEYVDEDGAELAPKQTATGGLLERFDDSLYKKSFDGYVLKNKQGWIYIPQIGEWNEVTVDQFRKYEQKIVFTYKKFDGPIKYQSLAINQVLNDSLESPSNLSFKDVDGTIIGELSYDEATQNIAATLLQESDQTKDLIVEYDAVVKKETPLNEVIKEKASAEGTYNSGDNLSKIESNEVATQVIAGELKFISAPVNLNFGEDLKISDKDEYYALQSKEDDLIVQDSRIVGKSWSMTAKLISELTSKSGHKLPNSLHYYHDEQDYLFSKTEAIPIYNTITQNNEAVVISNAWLPKKEGPLLEVKAGKPHNEGYQGSVEWTLQDVPSND